MSVCNANCIKSVLVMINKALDHKPLLIKKIFAHNVLERK